MTTFPEAFACQAIVKMQTDNNLYLDLKFCGRMIHNFKTFKEALHIS